MGSMDFIKQSQELSPGGSGCGCPVPTAELPFLLEGETTGSRIVNALGIPRVPWIMLDQSFLRD